jgi:hypothetical protein
VPLFSSFEAIAFVLRYLKQGVSLELAPSITNLAVGKVHIRTPKFHQPNPPPRHFTAAPHLRVSPFALRTLRWAPA